MEVDWIFARYFNAKLSPQDEEGGFTLLDPGDHFMNTQIIELSLIEVNDTRLTFT